jgi:hypothetical protein
MRDLSHGRGPQDPDILRRLMRVVCGVCFFGVDQHEVILPDLRRKTIERFQREKREPNAAEAKAALAEAKELGLFGFKVGSEIDLPSARVNYRGTSQGQDGTRELTSGHIRRGHVGFRACGEGRQDRRLVFVHPAIVRPDLPMQSSHGYRVRPPKAHPAPGDAE